MMDDPILNGEGTYLSSSSLVSYWTTFTLPGLAASAAAAIGGAILIAAGRAVLTGGVMIALALIPSATLVSMGLIAGEPEISGKAAVRWLADARFVLVLSMGVFAFKRYRVHRRDSMM
jgi:uncharacterized membrane protein